MAESVDALVSNTSGATRAGSTPALGTENTLQHDGCGVFSVCTVIYTLLYIRTFLWKRYRVLAYCGKNRHFWAVFYQIFAIKRSFVRFLNNFITEMAFFFRNLFVQTK